MLQSRNSYDSEIRSEHVCISKMCIQKSKSLYKMSLTVANSIRFVFLQKCKLIIANCAVEKTLDFQLTCLFFCLYGERERKK